MMENTNNEEKTEKLEFEHFAPYLPYKLKVQTVDEFNIKRNEDVVNLSFINKSVGCRTWDGGLTSGYSLNEVKPIFKPLSDLTKDNINNNDIDFELILFKDGDIKAANLSYKSYIWLIKNHYDYFKLIPKGLAININTLK